MANLDDAFQGLAVDLPPRRTSRPSSSIAPKYQQAHILASRTNEAARAAAYAILASAEVSFCLIGDALRKHCGALAPARLSDFPATALDEAATAYRFQLSGLNILFTSAKAHTGARHA